MASMICRVTISMPTGRTAATKRQKRLAATTPGAASQTMRNMGGTFRRELNRSCQSFFGIQTVSALIIFFTVAVVIWGPEWDITYEVGQSTLTATFLLS